MSYLNTNAYMYNLTSIVKHENPVKRITMLKFIVLSEVTQCGAVASQQTFSRDS